MTVYKPRLDIEAAGRQLRPRAAGPFAWTVHKRKPPVVFLTCALLGLSDGDAVDCTVAASGGSAAVLTTQGPTSLLRTAGPVRQDLALRVVEGSHLVYLPWLTIPFPGSSAVLRNRVMVEPGASFVAWDILAVGRAARGEAFDFHSLYSEWAFFSGPEPDLLDRLSPRGGMKELNRAAFGGRTHLGSLYIAGIGEERLPVAAVREALTELDCVGVSRPSERVLVVRALSTRADELEAAFWPVVERAQAAAGAAGFAPGDVARRWM